MSLSLRAAKAPVAKICAFCGTKLTLSNKSKPPRCYNTETCQSRAMAGAPKVQHTPPRNYLNEGLTESRVIAALVSYYNYSRDDANELLKGGNSSKLMHARYVLVFLFVSDLKLSYLQVERYLHYERRTVSSAYHEVKDAKFKYEKDINGIREKYDLQKSQKSAKSA